jgi:hypothetical protein
MIFIDAVLIRGGSRISRDIPIPDCSQSRADLDHVWYSLARRLVCVVNNLEPVPRYVTFRQAVWFGSVTTYGDDTITALVRPLEDLPRKSRET